MSFPSKVTYAPGSVTVQMPLAPAPTFDDTCALAVELVNRLSAMLPRVPAGPAAHAAADALSHARETVHALTAVSMHGGSR